MEEPLQLDANLSIRRLTISDVADLAKHANSKNIWNNLRDYFPYPYSKQDAKEYIEFTKEGKEYVYGIEYYDEIVGVCGLVKGQDVYRLSAELGFWLGEEYWSKGIMTKVVDVVVNLGFSQHHFNRISAHVFKHNTASMRVLEKCGFKLEAVHKNAVIKNGVVSDEYVFVKFPK